MAKIELKRWAIILKGNKRINQNGSLKHNFQKENNN